jgi:hypothetical protein
MSKITGGEVSGGGLLLSSIMNNNFNNTNYKTLTNIKPQKKQTMTRANSQLNF